jgi:23S rRNA (adenine2503-C2)-methyltransferase
MVGCPVGCRFCAAGTIKFERPLTHLEMSYQAEHLISLFDDSIFPKITCSFQGIGEPSLVPCEVLSAARIIAKRSPKVHISIATTLANPNAIDLWGGSDVVFDNLQLSCSATNRTAWNRIVPRESLAEDIFCFARYCRTYPNFRKVKINYVLIAGVNDSDSDLKELIRLGVPSGLTVKISTLNPTRTSRRFNLAPSGITRAKRFRDELIHSGADSYIYGAFDGTTISCGQLLEPSAAFEGAS